MKKITFIISLIVLLAACTTQNITQNDVVNENKDLSSLATNDDLKKFTSVSELIQYLEDNSGSNNMNAYPTRGGGMMKATFAMAEDSMMAAPIAGDINSGTDENYANDYSETNIQVKGVDEADYVKNDGKYIYMIADDRLVIIDAYPAVDAEIISKTDIEGSPQSIFVKDDKVVVFTIIDDEEISISKYDFVPRPTYTQRTHAQLFDISDKEKPEMIEDYSIDGHFFQARMIGEYVYFITKENVYYYNHYVDTPTVRSGKSRLFAPEIYYFDNPEDTYVFHTIGSFDINGNNIDAKSFLMGYSNTVYVSNDNIYVTYQKNLPWRYYERYNEDRFYDIILPLFPSDVSDKISQIQNDDGLTSPDKWEDIQSVIENMYNNMDENDKKNLIEEIETTIEEYEIKQEEERRKTIIQKFSIDEGAIDYVSKGEVKGHLLNQFSLDEYDGNLRVATTLNFWTRSKSEQHNNVYVLDEDLDLIGELEGIAPDERIYSTRFMGEKLYMVTFQRIDPLFVIDLSDPNSPEILGELKIPGFTEYLHPYDKDHLIGIGKETEDKNGRVTTLGLKISLFDVSDLENPKEMDNYVIGESGTNSEALYEHKAFLFDKQKNILVLPVSEVTGKTIHPQYGYETNLIWYGAYVLGITPDSEIKVKGKIEHGGESSDYRYYNNVRRSLYMEDTLYTISERKIVMSNLVDLGEIGEIKLPYDSPNYGYEKPMPMIESTAVDVAVDIDI